MKRQQFTLVELLTVIAIIGILAAIIIPTVGKARSTAQRTQCVNNYKQLGTGVLCYRADNKGFMPIVHKDYQIIRNPIKRSTAYNVIKKNGQFVGVLDYAYINSFIVTSGPDSDGNCTVSDAPKSGRVWICPNVQRFLQASTLNGYKDCVGMGVAIANRDGGKYNYTFFSPDPEKPTHIPTNAPASLDLCPMMAEMCANSMMNGATGDSQKGLRATNSDGSYIMPAPHDGFYATCWMDGHAEAIPGDKNRFLNWQPYDENDKYYAPFGTREQGK